MLKLSQIKKDYYVGDSVVHALKGVDIDCDKDFKPCDKEHDKDHDKDHDKEHDKEHDKDKCGCKDKDDYRPGYMEL